MRFRALLAACILCTPAVSSGQVIRFESGGLEFQTLTKNGVTIMFAPIPIHIREYNILHIAVSNGSRISWNVKSEDCVFVRNDGTSIPGAPAKQVVGRLIEKGSRNDVIKLVQTYELSIYGMSRFKSTNGYEQRRQSAFAEVSSTKIKAAAAASAVAFPNVKLLPGKSTDGSVFYPTGGKGLGSGKLVVHIAGEVFEFEEIHSHQHANQ